MSSSDQRSRLTQAAVLSVALVAGVAATFWPALGAEFVRWDDPKTVVGNAEVHGLSAESVRWAFTHAHMGHYHPLTWLSYMLEHEAWGLDARRYHATNLVIHAINCLLVYALGLKLIVLARGTNDARKRATGGEHLAAALGAALFAVHPLRVETVAWVTERRDVLSAMFLLLAALAYLRSVEPGRVPLRSIKWSVVSVVLLLLSVLSKAWGMSFFAIVLLMDVFPLRRPGPTLKPWFSRGGLRVILQKWAYVLIGVATAAAAAWAQQTGEATKSLAEWGARERLVQSVYGLWFYLKTSVWPFGLSPLYELPTKLGVFEGRFVAAYVGVGALIALAVWKWKKWPALGVVLAAYVVLLAPVLGVLQSGDQFVADRYSYLACIGWSVLVGVVVAALAGKASKLGGIGSTVVWACAIGLVTWLGVLARAQTAVWHDTLSLWSYATSQTPSPRVRTSYSLELSRLGRNEEAKKQLELALKEREDNGLAWALLADLELDSGNTLGAELPLIMAVRYLKPPAVAMVNLGSLYLTKLNRPKDALAQFEAAVKSIESSAKPTSSGGAYLGLGVSRRVTGDREGARAALRRAMEFEDTKGAAQQELARLDAASPNAKQ